jgi:hypothetical protein
MIASPIAQTWWVDQGGCGLAVYGRGVVVLKNYSRDEARKAGDNAATAMKSVVVDLRLEGDLPTRFVPGDHFIK